MIPIVGGIYLNNNTESTYVPIQVYKYNNNTANFIYIRASEMNYYMKAANIVIEEGTVLTIDGVYSRPYAGGYALKFNKVSFRYTNGEWITQK